MNPVDLEIAVRARLVTSTVGEVQGVWNSEAPHTIKLAEGSDPYVVFLMAAMTIDDDFENNAADVLLQVSIFDHRDNPFASIRAVYDLVMGDSQGTDNAPTVGLHRWKATGMTSIEDTVLQATQVRALHDQSAWNYQIDFIAQAQEK